MDDMKELLREILQSDRRLLQDRQALIARLDSKVNGSMVREFASLKTALQRNVGERFLAADNASREEQKNVCAEVERQLVQEGMQEKRANGVVEALSYALGWGEKEPLEESNPLSLVKDSTKLIITPHLAWASVEARTRCVRGVYDNIASFLRGEARNVVNP